MRIEKLSSQGKAVVFVMTDGKLTGAIALADIVREESRKAISKLKGMGIRCMMLTGDNKKVAKWVSEEIGLDEYFAEVFARLSILISFGEKSRARKSGAWFYGWGSTPRFPFQLIPLYYFLSCR